MVAASVFPSPVFISAILPSCKTIPPISCTSKGRIPKVRLDASRTTAKASGRMSSRVSPCASLSLNSSVLSRSSSSERFSTSGSKAVTAATPFWRALTFRPSPIRKILVNKLFKASFLARASLGRRAGLLYARPLTLSGLYQPVIAITTPVYHIYLARIRVGEDEKGVVEEFHLQRRLLGAHRLHLELLGAHDASPYLVRLFLDDEGLRGLFLDVPLPLAPPTVDLAPPVTPYLPLELVRHAIYGRVHVRRGLPGLQNRAVDKEGRLGNLGLGDRRVAFVDQLHLRPRVAAPVVEELGRSLDLLRRVPLQGLRHRDVAPLDRYLHGASLRSAAISF